jgi:hypothetical protein
VRATRPEPVGPPGPAQSRAPLPAARSAVMAACRSNGRAGVACDVLPPLPAGSEQFNAQMRSPGLQSQFARGFLRAGTGGMAGRSCAGGAEGSASSALSKTSSPTLAASDPGATYGLNDAAGAADARAEGSAVAAGGSASCGDGASAAREDVEGAQPARASRQSPKAWRFIRPSVEHRERTPPRNLERGSMRA